MESGHVNAVQFDGVSKRFILRHERPRSLQELFLNTLRLRTGPGKEEYWALRDVSFEVEQGEMVGIVGPNGAGKSTILKLISRIIEPTAGRVEANGRIGALLELGAGFHDDLTGRENIYLNGSILGFTRDELTRMFEDIVGFAEMASFIDVPVKQYSSGMFMRLGFSVAVHLRPEILLVDEVLAVGDRSFRLRCLDRINELKQGGVTVVLVSHDLAQVREMCQRAFWLSEGRLQAEGSADEVVEAYVGDVLEKNNRPQKERDLDSSSGPPRSEATDSWRRGSGEAQIVRVQFLDDNEKESQSFQTGDTLIARVHFRAHQRIEAPVFGIAVHHVDGFHLYGPNTGLSEYPIDEIEGDGFLDFIIPSLPLLQGVFLVSVGIFDIKGIMSYDYHHQAHRFRVVPGPHTRPDHGVLCIPGEWRMGDQANAGKTGSR
jgi:lipopolysaccharide transport system ATP-binding protein